MVLFLGQVEQAPPGPREKLVNWPNAFRIHRKRRGLRGQERIRGEDKGREDKGSDTMKSGLGETGRSS
jgi:hypothetical protein